VVLPAVPAAASSAPAAVSWAALTAAQLGALTPDDFADATAADFSLIPAAACTNVSAPQLAAAATRNAPFDQCSGFTAACIAAMPSPAFAQISDKCLSFISLGRMPAASVAASDADSWVAVTRSQVATMGSNCAGFTAMHLESLAYGVRNHDACSGLTTACVQHIPVDAFTGLGIGCAGSLSLDAVSAAQLAAIEPERVPWFSSTQLAELQDGCAGFTANQAARLSYGYTNSDACAGLTARCWSAMDHADLLALFRQSLFSPPYATAGMADQQRAVRPAHASLLVYP
jgi:hypothetical protein